MKNPLTLMQSPKLQANTNWFDFFVNAALKSMQSFLVEEHRFTGQLRLVIYMSSQIENHKKNHLYLIRSPKMQITSKRFESFVNTVPTLISATMMEKRLFTTQLIIVI